MPGPAVRDALLAAGAVEFQQHGYHATGIAAIAERAGAFKGSFYNHFASKEAFAIEVLAGYARDGRIELLAADGPPAERIRAHFRWLHQQLEQRGYAFGCLLGNFAAEAAADNPALREAIDACFAAWTDALAAAIERLWVAADRGSRNDPRAVAEVVIDAWEGALMRAKVSRDAGPVEVFMDVALERLLA